MVERLETPERMVTDGSFTSFGKFKDPFGEVNMLDAEIQLGGRTAPIFLRNMRLKEWEHFGFVHDEYFFGVAIFTAKFMTNSWIYAFNRKTGEFHEHSRMGAANPVGVARELWHGECYYRHIGYRIEFENRLDKGFHRITADVKQSKDKPSLKADLRMLEDLDRFEPLVVVSPVGMNRGLYTHKSVCPAEGTVELGGKKIVLDPSKHVAILDVQKTHYPYDTFWKWSTFGGYDADGHLLAMNICQNFIEDDERYNENCTWVDGKITPISAARFSYDECDLMAPWKLSTTAGELDLEFKPAGERVGRVNLGILMSDFHQPFGEFKGSMAGPGGERFEIDGQFGVCEHHLAKF